MEKLFDDSLFIQKQRPKQITKEQEEKMFTDLANEVIKLGFSDGDMETIVEDLKKLSIRDSGFERAKDLDSYGNAEYEFDGEFIDWLDSNMDDKREEILKENVRLWVKAHNIQATLKAGDCLKVIKSINYKIKKDSIIYIISIKEDDAVYVVSEDKNRKGGYLIDFENIESNCEIEFGENL